MSWRSEGRPGLLLGLAAAIWVTLGAWHVSLWSDEAATVSAATRGLADLGRMVERIDAVHGTYYLLMHGWVTLVGTSPFALRLPSALAVGAAVAGTYLLARRWTDRPTAVIAAVVLALLPRVTWAGIEARPFALAMALAVGATLVLDRALDRGGPARWVGYAALIGLATAVELYVVLVAAAHAVTVLLRDRRRLPSMLAAAAGGGLLVAPVVLTALGQGGQLGSRPMGLVALARNVLVDQWFLGETPTPTTASGATLALTDGGAWKLAALAMAALGWALVARSVAVRTGAARTVLRWAVPWLVLPTAVVAGASLVAPHLYNSRYFGFSAPALALLVAVGLRALGRRGTVGLVLLAVTALPVYLSQRTVSAKAGADWVLVAEQLAGRTAPGDGVYFGPRDDPVDGLVLRSLRTASLAYPAPFDGLVDVTLVASPADGGTLFGTSGTLAEHRADLAGLDTLWVLRRQDRPQDASAEDALLAAEGFTVAWTWQGPQTELLELTRD